MSKDRSSLPGPSSPPSPLIDEPSTSDANTKRAPISKLMMLLQTDTVMKSKIDDVMIKLSSVHDQTCMLCGTKEISEKLYGMLYRLGNVVVHYYCVLFATRVFQTRSVRDGVMGFFLKDINTEILRAAREPCIYCNKMGATIRCADPKCMKIFHLPCGLKNESLHQYFDNYKSFCKRHRVKQMVDLQAIKSTEPVECIICKEDILPTPTTESLWAPCCKHSAWFHRKCIQDLALSAGHRFKCPLCNDSRVFNSKMITLGVYVPDREASWEVESMPQGIHRYSCSAEVCMFPYEERKYLTDRSGPWVMMVCRGCGSKGTHKLCSYLLNDEVVWYCSEECSPKKDDEMDVQSEVDDDVIFVGSSRLEYSFPPNSNLNNVSRNAQIIQPAGVSGIFQYDLWRGNEEPWLNEVIHTLRQQQREEPIVISDTENDDTDSVLAIDEDTYMTTDTEGDDVMTMDSHDDVFNDSARIDVDSESDDDVNGHVQVLTCIIRPTPPSLQPTIPSTPTTVTIQDLADRGFLQRPIFCMNSYVTESIDLTKEDDM